MSNYVMEEWGASTPIKVSSKLNVGFYRKGEGGGVKGSMTHWQNMGVLKRIKAII